ncbi:MAG TPA: hypothetical protein PLA27_08415, partial [Anaerolineales bacterium]|nr:hypothetical protein [Anaerolineales bacterium]
WTMDDGRWTMDDGRWTMDSESSSIACVHSRCILPRHVQRGDARLRQSKICGGRQVYALD